MVSGVDLVEHPEPLRADSPQQRPGPVYPLAVFDKVVVQNHHRLQIQLDLAENILIGLLPGHPGHLTAALPIAGGGPALVL